MKSCLIMILQRSRCFLTSQKLQRIRGNFPKLASTLSCCSHLERCAFIRKHHLSTQYSSSVSVNTDIGVVKTNEDTGLFNYPEFRDTAGFAQETKKCIERSKELVAMITAQADSPDMSIIDHMDQLSDELCRVADLAECIRQVHPDPEMASTAHDACLTINSYVEELNTDTGLYTALRKLMNSEKYESYDEVTKRTAEVFMHDFEISGIHLKESIRKEVVQLNSCLLELGYSFSLSTSQPTLVHRDMCLPALRSHYFEDNDQINIDHVPYHSSDPTIRENAYRLYYAQDEQRMEVFEEMISNRQKLARLVGYPSFAHRVLKMSMAEKPEVVTDFLECLSDKILPLAKDDVVMMRQFQNDNKDDCTNVHQWDIHLLESKAKKLHLPQGVDLLKNWFSLDSCIGGLCGLFESLFGVRLEVLPVKKGEVWHPSVYKFGFIDDGGHLLGYTYGDLIYRETQLASDCHFTIRGGCELTGGQVAEYQVPVITLCCSIEKPTNATPSLLSRHNVETLFHEMGHALHSMLGRAKYQNITGTRCSTDFAEVPSTLMEFFLNDDRVLESFAKHHKTGKILPSTLVREFQLSGHFLAAYDMQVQISNAIADQRFHSEAISPSESPGWSAEVYRKTAEQYSPLDHVPNTAYYLRFPHLCSYGGRYYSYLWSRAVASLIWKSSFSRDPFSQVAGEKLRTMLSCGGGINPRVLVRDMLGFEPSVEQLVDALHGDVLKQREQIQYLVSEVNT